MPTVSRRLYQPDEKELENMEQICISGLECLFASGSIVRVQNICCVIIQDDTLQTYVKV